MDRIQQYRESKALSYSALSLWRYNPKLYEAKYVLGQGVEKESTGFRLGSALDCLITEGKQAFDAKYAVTQVDLNAKNNVSKFLLELSKGKTLEEAYTSADIKRPLLSGLVSDIIENPHTRIAYDAITEGKVLLTPEEHNAAIEMEKEYRRIEEKHFLRLITDTVYQKPLYFQFAHLEMKTLPDVIYEHPIDNEVTVVDIKTTSGNLNEVSAEFEKWNYWIQAHMHCWGAMKEYSGKVVTVNYVFISSKFPYNSRLVKCIYSFDRFNKLVTEFKNAVENRDYDYSTLYLEV